MSVEADFGAWLKSASLIAVASSDALAAAWGDLAAKAELVSALAEKADAETEANRQLTLFGAPMVLEVLQVDGLRIDLIGKPVTLRASRTGYANGANVFVIGAREVEQVERTNLTVLRKLA
ncbi:hypothetical protein [Sphingobium sp. YR768]|uniref:hypothetical protein n=1 Tax=Sphingobium sp. YR768 TaxID=1884365 RepID=UPI0008C30DF4|nr:hypothetical protein [Sphingobium sp. YR768]SES01435.1 hypothetical protein SAMN05518866_1312 [Sphingobium sp. YR768]